MISAVSSGRQPLVHIHKFYSLALICEKALLLTNQQPCGSLVSLAIEVISFATICTGTAAFPVQCGMLDTTQLFLAGLNARAQECYGAQHFSFQQLQYTFCKLPYNLNKLLARVICKRYATL